MSVVVSEKQSSIAIKTFTIPAIATNVSKVVKPVIHTTNTFITPILACMMPSVTKTEIGKQCHMKIPTTSSKKMCHTTSKQMCHMKTTSKPMCNMKVHTMSKDMCHMRASVKKSLSHKSSNHKVSKHKSSDHKVSKHKSSNHKVSKHKSSKHKSMSKHGKKRIKECQEIHKESRKEGSQEETSAQEIKT
jgi:hypothetical protein